MNNNVITVQINGVNVQIQVRENARSNRLSLKLHPLDDVIYLTKPPKARPSDITNFLEKSRGWLSKVVSERGSNISFKEGNLIPILGEEHLISYAYAERPRVKLLESQIHVQGFDPIIIPGLVKDFLRSHIYQYIADTSQRFAKAIGKEVNSITIKDTKTRWGSCSHDGNLCYSWRLVLAPESVAEYVCAHEVAHLIEMNHSVSFWKIVGSLCPDYVRQRRWLKANGKNLFRYG
jgi:predicted metal-dependent hydrolase